MESVVRSPRKPASGWHEIYDDAGQPRAVFSKLLKDFSELPPTELRALDDRLEATLREMGVTFDIIRNDPWGSPPWTCDLLPHVFTGADWELIVRGFRQRVRAFEAFLEDVYGPREILRANIVPIHCVLGSPHYQNEANGLARPRGAFLHLSGLCVSRDSRGQLQVKTHHLSHANGISYMMQNRRALARVAPEIFQDAPVQSLAEVPLLILERLRETAASFGGEPTVVLLSPGADGAVTTEQSFLARRMGIPTVQGGDLLVLDDRVHLKTVRGLESVEVIYNRVADAWLDPLVFRRDSSHGIPGLVHCLRKGTVALVNAVGAQVADDRSLLAFAPQIIRFYLSETAILPTVPTFWLGDIDQREMVLESLADFHIRPVSRESVAASWERALPDDEDALRATIRREPAHFVAQPKEEGARTVCFEGGTGSRACAGSPHFRSAVRPRFRCLSGCAHAGFFARRGSGRFRSGLDEQGLVGPQRCDHCPAHSHAAARVAGQNATAPTSHEPRRGEFLLDGPLFRARASSSVSSQRHRNARNRGAELRRAPTLSSDVEPAAATAREDRRHEPSQHYHSARPISPGGSAGAGFGGEHVSPRVSQRRMRAGLAQPGGVGDDQQSAHAPPAEPLSRRARGSRSRGCHATDR